MRLVQAISNLLTNAAKYTEPHGRIWLSARSDRGEAVVSIRDSGIGIAPEALPHVFELFVQAHDGASKTQGGLGIGLTVAKNLIELHGGSIEAQSAGLGTGAEFIARLPLQSSAPNVEGESAAAQNRRPPPSRRRIVVVDDNRDAANSLSMLLRLQGHDVVVAHDGPSALAATQSFHPDVVFLDLGMPGMDGYEVASRIRKMPGMEKAVLAALTGWGQRADRRRTAEAGFNHHLVKPPEPKKLRALLEGIGNGGS